MQLNQRILSDLNIHMKYARYLPELQRRELWPEICERYAKMLIERYPHMEDEIFENLTFVLDKKVLPLPGGRFFTTHLFQMLRCYSVMP